jgi:hypothetical protein
MLLIPLLRPIFYSKLWSKVVAFILAQGGRPMPIDVTPFIFISAVGIPLSTPSGIPKQKPLNSFGQAALACSIGSKEYCYLRVDFNTGPIAKCPKIVGLNP